MDSGGGGLLHRTIHYTLNFKDQITHRGVNGQQNTETDATCGYVPRTDRFNKNVF